MRIIGFLTVVVLLVVVIGYFAGWIRISSDSNAGSNRINVELDKGELSSDVEGAKENIKGVIDDITNKGDKKADAAKKVVAGPIEREGVLAQVSSSSVTLVTADGVEHVFVLTSATVIEIEGVPSAATSLNEGDRAVVRVEREGTPNTAAKVSIRR